MIGFTGLHKACSHALRWRRAFLLPLVTGVISISVLAGSSFAAGGWVSDPVPATDPSGNGMPGCFITFGGPPSPDDRPCVMRCNGPVSDGLKTSATEACAVPTPGPGGSTTFDYNEKNRNPLLVDGPNKFWPYGKGPDGSITCQLLIGGKGNTFERRYFPKGHNMCAGVSGEPHIRTFDNVRYDLQAAGEFVAVRSTIDNFEVQIRLELIAPQIRNVTVATAVAAQVGPHRIMLSARDQAVLRINGDPLDLQDRRIYYHQDGDAAVIRRDNIYSLLWPDGTNLHVEILKSHLNFNILLAEQRDNKIVGLLGNADGSKKNDFVAQNLVRLSAKPTFTEIHNRFAGSWRVEQEKTLFEYSNSQNTSTYKDTSIPEKLVSLETLPQSDVERARMACEAGGVFDQGALEACVFDVAVTGDDRFVSTGLSQQAPKELMTAMSAAASGKHVDPEIGAIKISSTREPKIDRPGGDYDRFVMDIGDPDLCETACKKDQPQCKAWTYVKPGVQGPKAMCWLKKRVPTARLSQPCCESGVIKENP